MNMRDPEENLFTKSLAFCICFLLCGTTALFPRGSVKNPVRPNSIQFQVRNSTQQRVTGQKSATIARAYDRLSKTFIDNRRQVDGRDAFDEAGSGHTGCLTHRRILLSPKRTQGKVDRRRREAANPRAIPVRLTARRLSDVHASYLRVRMLAMNRGAEAGRKDVPSVKVDYFVVRDPHRRPTNFSIDKEILHRNACPGIDIRLYQKNYSPIIDPLSFYSAYSGAVRIYSICPGEKGEDAALGVATGGSRKAYVTEDAGWYSSPARDALWRKCNGCTRKQDLSYSIYA